MFDPFKDFETAGYLRNRFAEKDPQIIQEMEHQMFRPGLGETIAPALASHCTSKSDYLAALSAGIATLGQKSSFFASLQIGISFAIGASICCATIE